MKFDNLIENKKINASVSAIQYYACLDNDIDVIVTRNKKDYKTGKLPVMSAEEYLAALKSKKQSKH